MAPKPKLPLPPCGYLIAYLGLQPDVLAALQTEATSEAKSDEYVPVFEEVGGKGDDPYREQARVKKASGAIGDLKLALKAITSCLDPQWIPSVFSFMRSQPGGEEQEIHQDYPREVIEAAKKKKRVPDSMVLALEEGTRLRVYDGCTDTIDETKARVIDIPVGFCVIFRGDLAHNGMAYDTVNHRIHCYLTYRGLKWEPDIVSNVLPRHFDCQYCGVKINTSNAIRHHRRYCKDNPKAAENELVRRAPPKTIGPYVCNVCGDGYDNNSSYNTHIWRGHSKKQKTD